MTDQHDYWDGENWLIVVSKFETTTYYLNEEVHRSDGPAFIKYNFGFIPHIEEYFFNGKIYRKDGGSVQIIYNNDGTILKQFFYFNGIFFNPEDLPFDLPIDTEEKEFLFNLKCEIIR